MKTLLQTFRTVFLIVFSITSMVVYVPISSAASIVWEGDVDNNWSTDANWAGGTAPGVADVAVFDGTGDVDCTINASINVVGIQIDAGYTHTITQAVASEVLVGSYSQANGIFTGSNYFDLNGTFTLTGGTFNAPSGNMFIEGTFTHTGGGTFAHNNGTVSADGNDAVWDFGVSPGSGVFNNFIIKKNGTFGLSGDTLVVNANLTFENGTANNGTLSAKGDVYVEIGADPGGSAVLSFSHASANQAINLDNTGDATGNLDLDIVIDKASGRVDLDSNLVMNAASQDLTITSGTFATTGHLLEISGAGGVFGNAGTLQIYGNETLTMTNDASGGIVEYVGVPDFAQTDLTLKDWDYYNLSVNMTDATDTLTDGGASRSVAGNFTLSSGSYTATSGITTVGDDFSVLGSGVFVHGGGTVTLTGNSNLAFEYTSDGFYNLIIDAGANTMTLLNNIWMRNDLTITSGILDVSASNYSVTVARNFMNNGTGDFTAREGTVTIDDVGKTSWVSGDTTFYNLTCSAGKIITIAGGTTQTVGGLFTALGSAGNLVTLKSSNTTPWNLVLNGTSNVDYVDLKYSALTGTLAPLAAGDNSVDSGNNTGWVFNNEPVVDTPTASVATDATGAVTTTFDVEDEDDDTTLQAVIEYSYDGGAWTKATISETSGTGSDYGSFNVENDNVWQVGNSNGYISAASGTNTIYVTWNSQTDLPTADSTAQFRVLLFDGTGTGTTGTSAVFTIDNVAPAVGLTSLSSASVVYTSFTLSWDAITTETNFDKYQIYYKLSSADTYTLYSEESTLTTGSKTITGLAEGTAYTFYVKALDTFGNSLTSTTFSVTMEDTSDPYFGAVTGGGGGGGSSPSSNVEDSSIDESADESETEEETSEELAGEEEVGEENYDIVEEEEETVWLPTGVEIPAGEEEAGEENYEVEEIEVVEPTINYVPVVNYVEPVEVVPAEVAPVEEPEEIIEEEVELVDETNVVGGSNVTVENAKEVVKDAKEVIKEANFSFNAGEVLEDSFADSDDDNISDVWETVYFGSSDGFDGSADTDGDGLTDEAEYASGGNPLSSDTDNDGTSDYDEVMIYGTDPNSWDTDGDGVSDTVEVGTYGGGAATTKQTAIADAEIYGEDIDTDNDGMSDYVEKQYGTDPNNADTDGDGLTDTEELFEYDLNPNEVTYVNELPVKMTNVKKGDVFASSKVLFKGTAGSEMRVLLTVMNENDDVVALLQDRTDEKGKFVANLQKELPNGNYKMFVSEIDEGEKVIDMSTLTTFEVDYTQEVAEVEAAKEFTKADNGLSLGLKTKPGTTMYFTWRSMVFSSVLVADMETGELVVSAPSELETGDHVLYVYAVDEETGVRGETMMVNFSITDEGFADITATPHQSEVTGTQSSYAWLLVLGLLAIGGFGIFIRNSRKQHKEERKLIDRL